MKAVFYQNFLLHKKKLHVISQAFIISKAEKNCNLYFLHKKM